MPPQQKMTQRRSKRRYIPAEIIEEILLNLPYKSLFRFSSVSRSWNSMIAEPCFVKKYHKSERNFLFLSSETADSTCPISPISWDGPSVHEIDFVSPFDEQPRLMAMCDELWLADDGKSLFLWSPSMGTRRKIPNPRQQGTADTFTYGLGYDSIADDYKIVKISRSIRDDDRVVFVELYSLRSDSWRDVEIPEYSKANSIDTGGSRGCLFVSGRLHWVKNYDHRNKLISFDFSTEKFKNLAMPPLPKKSSSWRMEASVLRGMLCVSYSLNRYTFDDDEKIVCTIWVMEDYGVVESWKKSTIEYGHSIPMFNYQWIVPLYYYDNGEFLLRVEEDGRDGYIIYAYKDAKTRPRELIRSCTRGRILRALLYKPIPLSRQLIFSN